MPYNINPFTGKFDDTGNWGSTTLYFVENGDDLELWWHNSLVQKWTMEIKTGKPYGLLLALTQP